MRVVYDLVALGFITSIKNVEGKKNTNLLCQNPNFSTLFEICIKICQLTTKQEIISPYTKYAKYKACLPDLHILQGWVIKDESCAYSWARFCTGSRLDPFTLSRDRCQRVMVKNCKKVQYCKPVFVSVGILCEKAQQHLLLCKKVFSTISKTN